MEMRAGSPVNFDPIEAARVLVVEDFINGSISFLVGNSTPAAKIEDIIPGSIILIADKRPFMDASLVWQSMGAKAIVIYYGVHEEAIGFPECSFVALASDRCQDFCLTSFFLFLWKIIFCCGIPQCSGAYLFAISNTLQFHPLRTP
jgi:hypothetical protein